MANTTNLQMPLMEANQASKHVTHNEALRILDAVVQIGVINTALTTPPGSPADGDRYIIPSGATGAWSGQTNKLALRASGAWVFYAPRAGWIVWNAAGANIIVWDGSAWVPLPSAPITTATIFGVGGATADATNKLAVYSTNSLFNSAGSVDITLNKANAGDDASFSFKHGFSVRALFGLLANNDFTLKVSPNGSSYFNALVADRASGLVTLPNGVARNCPAPTAFTATGTVAAADVQKGIMTYSGSTGTLTLPTGTLLDALFVGMTINTAIEFSLINLAASTGPVTIAAGTGGTIVGNAVTAAGESSRWAMRKTAAATYTFYRIA